MKTILLCGMSRKWNFAWNLIITILQKNPNQTKNSHMLIFQWHLIYILLMRHSSYNRAFLGTDVKNINEVALQIIRKMQYYGRNWHINWKQMRTQ